MRLLQACDEKLRADLLEAVVAPLRLAKAKAEKESEEMRKVQESSYRCITPATVSRAVTAVWLYNTAASLLFPLCAALPMPWNGLRALIEAVIFVLTLHTSFAVCN